MSMELCRLTDIPENGGLGVEYDGPCGRRRLVLFRTQGGLRAFLDVCPHQGRSLEFAPGEYLLDEREVLICPHHGASFELAGGACLSGPCAGDRLTRIEVRVAGETVWLDESG
jgi:nitrite reductase/ring-hydroxylating ferredoxin subunit